jgi:hypothetical protein
MWFLLTNNSFIFATNVTMSESLKYYPNATLIDGKLGTEGAGELKTIVEAKTLRMLDQVNAPGITQRPDRHMHVLSKTTSRARDIYPMGTARSGRGGRLVVSSRR